MLIGALGARAARSNSPSAPISREMSGAPELSRSSARAGRTVSNDAGATNRE
jgi:hypothetical protein